MSNTTPPYPLPPGDQQQPQPGQYQPGSTYQPQQMPLEPKYNVLAIISLVSAFVISLAAIITGHIALSQIKKTGEKGRGLALAGVILGYIGIVAGAVVIVVMIMVGISAGQAAVAEAQRQQDAIASQPAAAAPTNELPTDSGQAAGTVSPEFCAVLIDSTAKVQAAATSADKEAASLLAFEALAAVPGPNQSAYTEFYDFMRVHGEETGTLPPEVAVMQTMFQADVVACQTLAGL